MNDEVEVDVHNDEAVHEAVDVEEDDEEEPSDVPAGELEEGETVLVFLDGDAGSPREFSSVEETGGFLDEVKHENLAAERE
ncbi:MAG: hypothetical protein GEU79_18880 [Acidimicrobiia bacterium]|nr:hypothetical protein [Acidimicrobiia bacterium]